MGKFLWNIQRTLPILVQRFDPDKFWKGHAGAIGDGRATKSEKLLLSELGEALQEPFLVEKANVLRVVCFAVDRQATKLEGCRCHEHLLDRDGVTSWAVRLRRFRKASSSCVWKGRRSVELALGLVNDISENIHRASDRFMQEILATASDASRANMLQMEASLKSCIRERITFKL